MGILNEDSEIKGLQPVIRSPRRQPDLQDVLNVTIRIAVALERIADQADRSFERDIDAKFLDIQKLAKEMRSPAGWKSSDPVIVDLKPDGPDAKTLGRCDRSGEPHLDYGYPLCPNWKPLEVITGGTAYDPANQSQSEDE